MRGAAFEHPQNRPDDAAHRPQLLGSAPVEGRRRREEVAEQLERPVDQMDDHDSNDTAGGPRRKPALITAHYLGNWNICPRSPTRISPPMARRQSRRRSAPALDSARAPS